MAHDLTKVQTVGELIEKLQGFRPEAKLVFNGLGGTKIIVGIMDYETEFDSDVNGNPFTQQTVEIQLLNTELI